MYIHNADFTLVCIKCVKCFMNKVEGCDDLYQSNLKINELYTVKPTQTNTITEMKIAKIMIKILLLLESIAVDNNIFVSLFCVVLLGQQNNANK